MNKSQNGLTEKQKFILCGYWATIGFPLLLFVIRHIPSYIISSVSFGPDDSNSNLAEKPFKMPFTNFLESFQNAIFYFSLSATFSFTLALIFEELSRVKRYNIEEYKSAVKLYTVFIFTLLWLLIFYDK